MSNELLHSRFFHDELKTTDWIRATSPACNCNNSRRIPTPHDTSADSRSTNSGNEQEKVEWPGLLTCAADREDHGTTGAYTAWPALAAEALCYIEGNCSCVDIAPALLLRICDPSELQILESHADAYHLHCSGD
jgi:hypothetical protein